MTNKKEGTRVAKVKHLGGALRTDSRAKRPLPPEHGVKRYIITSAQNATELNIPCWENMYALAKHYKAEVMVSRFRYMRNTPLAKVSEKPGSERQIIDPEHFHPWIEKFIVDEQVELAPGLVFCGELQISPTAVNPLTGMDGYTGRASCIVPHTKQFLKSIPSGKHEKVKMMYSTGTTTLRNYIQARAGQKASFHHIYGGLLVEVNHEGTWFVRQLQADTEGVVYDLDLKVCNGVVMAGYRAEAIVWGDTHVAEVDPYVVAGGYTMPGNMMDALQPRVQFQHDVLDFRSANIHNIKYGLHHSKFRDYWKGHVSVKKELDEVNHFLDTIAHRHDCSTIVVNSNHDNFLKEWLKVGNYKKDPVNAEIFLKAELFMHEQLRRNPEQEPRLLQQLLQNKGVKFLDEDESFVICRDANGGIECGMHGHRGANGARGSLQAFARMGRKCIVGHSHTAGIFEGAWQVGLSGKMEQGYNVGPSSWSHSHCVVYANGKRAMITMYDGQWRA